MGHQRGLVALSPQRNGGEERSVRLDQDPVARGEHGGIAYRLRLRISKVPGKREVKSGGKRALGLFDRPREAVHDAAEAGRRPMFANHCQQVLPRVSLAEFFLGLRSGKLTGTTVDQDRFAKFGGQAHLGNKSLLLNPDLRVVEMVVVQADLANRDASLVERKAGQPVQGFAGGTGGLLGMNANARVDDRQPRATGCVGYLERLVHGRGAFADADCEDRLDTGSIGAAQNLVALSRSLGIKVEVGVGIGQRHRVVLGYCIPSSEPVVACSFVVIPHRSEGICCCLVRHRVQGFREAPAEIYPFVSPPTCTTQYFAVPSPTFRTVCSVSDATKITPPGPTFSDLPSCSKDSVPSTTTITSVC